MVCMLLCAALIWWGLRRRVLSMKRGFNMMFALGGYAAFGVAFTYYFGWLTGVLVPYSASGSAALVVLSDGAMGAWAVNTLLIGLFLVPHSVMARPWFKRWWTRFVPWAIERAVYVWYSSLSMMLMMALWQPIDVMIWDLSGGAAVAVYAVFGIGALGLVVATFNIDHFSLFGLSQAFSKNPVQPSFSVRGLYGMVRHPIALFNIVLVWATPQMSAAHMLYTALATFYVVFVTFRYEEPDLVEAIGAPYEAYQETTPAICPFSFGRKA